MKLTGEELEYAVSQYVDGTLSAIDRRVLDEQLAVDPHARMLVAEFTGLNDLLRANDPLPAVDFRQFAATVSAAIAQEKIPHVRPLVLRPAFMRFVAVAAGLALVVTAGVHFASERGRLGDSASTAVASTGSLKIEGPTIEVASIAPTIQLTVGPSEALAKRGDNLSIGEEALITPSPRVVISAADISNKSDVPLY